MKKNKWEIVEHSILLYKIRANKAMSYRPLKEWLYTFHMHEYDGIGQQEKPRVSCVLIGRTLPAWSRADFLSTAHVRTETASIVNDRACTASRPQFIPNSHHDKKLSSC